MIDAHNHLHQIPDPDRRIAEMKSIGITGCVVNATSQADWNRVAELAERHPGFIHPAFGLHPWFAAERRDDWLDELTALLDRFPNASLGECGLDRWIDHPPIDEQLAVFLPQLALARERDLPLTCHALKAWEPLFDALESEPPPAAGFLLHSFSGSPELVARLSPLGARFSISGQFLQPRRAKALDAFRIVPPERLMLETDAPDMLPPADLVTHPLPDGRNHPANLPSIARALADRLNEDPDSLIARTTANTRRFFRLP